MTIKASARLIMQDPDQDIPGAFGYGCALLLAGVRETGSLNKAAKRLGMAYSKAWRIVNEAEAHVGCDLLLRDGARGSTLTPAGERALDAYTTLQHEIDELLARRVPELMG